MAAYDLSKNNQSENLKPKAMKKIPMLKKDIVDTPIFGSNEEQRVAPKTEMTKEGTAEDIAYQIVHDEAMLDGNARLNLATFVTTWMDDSARRIMAETMDKNMIDKTEYPQTAEIERRCVNIIAKLWNSPEAVNGQYCMGTSTVGSSEATCMGKCRRKPAHIT